MRKSLRRILVFAIPVVAVMTAWITYDLIAPTKRDIRDFDPDEVARSDGRMWRSYYERDRLRLFLQLGDLLGQQYGFRFWRRQLTAFHAARAAFIFKGGRNRGEYEAARPDLEAFFTAIRNGGNNEFDPARAAELELEWWIVHRERQKFSEDDLAHALAAAAGAVYGIPPDRLHEYGKFRAQAMRIRDEQAERGGVTEDDWLRIDELLQRSWRSLRSAVKSPETIAEN